MYIQTNILEVCGFHYIGMKPRYATTFDRKSRSPVSIFQRCENGRSWITHEQECWFKEMGFALLNLLRLTLFYLSAFEPSVEAELVHEAGDDTPHH